MAEPSIKALRKLVDLSPYLVRDEAPAWLSATSSLAAEDLGVLALVGPGGISVATEDGDHIRPVLDVPSICLSGLADHAVTSACRLAIGLPPAAKHLPLLLVAAAALGKTLRRYSRPDEDTTGGGILTISPDLELRSRYCDLYVGPIALDAAYPGSRLRPNGERVFLKPLRDEPTNSGVCFFLPQLQLPEQISFEPDLITVDFRFSRWVRRAASLAQWCCTIRPTASVIGLYSIGDEDTLHSLIDAGFTDVPFDHSAISSCLFFAKRQISSKSCGIIDWDLASASSFLSREHEVRTVPDSGGIEDVFETIGRFIDEQRINDNPDLNRARWILAVLTQMPVPPLWYEQSGLSSGRRTLKSLIDKLGSRSFNEPGLGPIMQTLRLYFRKAYDSLETGNRRTATLKTLLTELLKSDKKPRVLILVRDESMERALFSWLNMEAFPNAEWLNNIDVSSYANYSDIASTRYDVVVINGPFPRRYRWLAGAKLGAKLVFLTYSYEVVFVQKQLNYLYGDAASIQRAKRRSSGLRSLSPSVSESETSDVPAPTLSLRLPPNLDC